jgi:hypothetical protein
MVIGTGRQKRAELTFCWLGQEPYTNLDLKAVAGDVADEGVLNDADVIEEP